MKYIKKLSERTYRIYNKSHYNSSIAEYQRETVDLEESPFFSFFIKCHYYKNIIKNQVLLDEVIKDFEKYGATLKDSYNIHSYKTSLNYLYNCKLSFLLGNQKSLTYETVWSEYYNIKNIQDRTEIRNYFPYVKLGQWYSEYLSKNIT